MAVCSGLHGPEVCAEITSGSIHASGVDELFINQINQEKIKLSQVKNSYSLEDVFQYIRMSGFDSFESNILVNFF